MKCRSVALVYSACILKGYIMNSFYEKFDSIKYRSRAPGQRLFQKGMLGTITMQSLTLAAIIVAEKQTYRKFPEYLDTQNICCNHSKM